MSVHGGAGYTHEYKVDRFHRGVRLYEGITQIRQFTSGTSRCAISDLRLPSCFSPNTLLIMNKANTYEGTHDVLALILGRAITGIPAFGLLLKPQP